MRQEDNGPNLFTLLKEDIFKDDLHLEGVLMEYILLCLRLRREDFYVLAIPFKVNALQFKEPTECKKSVYICHQRSK